MITLRMITPHGSVELGDPPASRIPCTFCGGAAQVVAALRPEHRDVGACARCTAELIGRASDDGTDPTAPAPKVIA